MKTLSEELISDLIERTRNHINQAEKLKELSTADLNHRNSSESWSVLECIEHLNLYGDYYLPEIQERIKNSRHSAEAEFKAGLLGDYFAKAMLPNEKMSKMKTFKDKNPLGSMLDKKTLERFITQQKKTLELLDAARKVSLNKTKTGVSISKLIKLRLGDTFRVIIYHNQRHLLQANNVLKQIARTAQADAV